MEGIITKGIGGFYYIKVEDKLIECKARGKFRHNELTPMVGDRVEITLKGKTGTIDKIYKRQNEMTRPTVANISQALVVFAVKNPDINEDLLNRFLMLCEYNNIKAIVCFNKIDLIEHVEQEEVVDMIKKAGYEVMFLNAKEGLGVHKIREKLKGNVTVLCGPSGAGKSTILNKLAGKELMATGNISEKLKRGKHTTRHSELIEMDEGFLVDTPGFSSLNIDFIKNEEVQWCFPEFLDYINKCKFSSCIHYKEPYCAVKKAVEEGILSKKRYDFYIKIMEEKIRGKYNR